MTRVLWTAAAGLLAVSPVMALGGRAALAYGSAPWCSVTTEGGGIHYQCQYKSAADCQSHVIAGNRGYCNENPFYHGPKKRKPPPRHTRRH